MTEYEIKRLEDRIRELWNEKEDLLKENAELKKENEYIIQTLESKVEKLQEDLRNKRVSIKIKKAKIEGLEQQIKKMRCCQNCKYYHCSWSSETIKDGKRTVHCWNEEKRAYCDIGEGAKYQLWEIKENG